jgi:hypothetical protein
MISKETLKSALIARGLAARDSAREANRYISSDQVMAELALMLKQVQRTYAAKTKQESLPR